MTYQHADLGSASDRLVGVDASVTSSLLRQGGSQDKHHSQSAGAVLSKQVSGTTVSRVLRWGASTAVVERIAAVFSDYAPVRGPVARQANFRLPDAADTDYSDFRPVGGDLKRVIDIVIAGTALVLLSPLMLIIAFSIWLSMGQGPVVFAQSRIGFGGKAFVCFKFRTMVCDGEEVLRQHLERSPHAAAEWQTSRKLARDPRVTTLGHILRKSSLDELPQLVNILLGHMSCVGPRPIVAAEIRRYGASLHEYISCRPGLTGLWQISGRSSRSYDDRVALDRLYARRWSLGMDLRILLATIPAVVKFKNTA